MDSDASGWVEKVIQYLLWNTINKVQYPAIAGNIDCVG